MPIEAIVSESAEQRISLTVQKQNQTTTANEQQQQMSKKRAHKKSRAFSSLQNPHDTYRCRRVPIARYTRRSDVYTTK